MDAKCESAGKGREVIAVVYFKVSNPFYTSNGSTSFRLYEMHKLIPGFQFTS
jgi:hypothetical protein